MVTYNNDWLYNIHVRTQADEALHEGCITPEVHETIYAAKEVGFYTPNYFVRIGLALLTLIIVVFSLGLFGLMTGGLGGSIPVLLLLFGLCSYIAAEVLVRSKYHYNSGVDNMLVWVAALLVYYGITYFSGFDGRESGGAAHYLIISVVCGALAMRFVDSFLSVLATYFLLLFVVMAMQGTGAPAGVVVPVALILVSGGLYFVFSRALANPRMVLYKLPLKCVTITLLIALYAAGNYHVATLLNESARHIGYGYRHDYDYAQLPQTPLSLGWFFWIWTFVVPMVYIGLGIRNKSITFIRVGVPLIAVAVLTFRQYHSVMSPEAALLLGGTVSFGVAYALISYLRTPKGGFTFQPGKHYAGDPLVSGIAHNVLRHSKDTFLNK